MSDGSELKEAVQALAKDQGAEATAAFSGVLKRYADMGMQIFMPGRNDGEGFHLKVLTARGKRFAALYSHPSEARSPETNGLCLADLNQVLDAVFRDNGLSGIVIDPFTTALCLEKHFLLKCLLHGIYPAEAGRGPDEPKEWGDGIPSYTEADVMTGTEIQNFALNSVLEHDEQMRKNYTFVSSCDTPGVIPSLILEKDGQFSFVYIKGHTSQDEPELTAEETDSLQKLAQRYAASCYWAPVGFYPAEPDRYAAGLYLRGDVFICRYEGLREVL